MGKQLAWLGSSLTIFYLVGLTWFTWGRLACLHTMPLNELGDFLAGAFGPLAILWLVLGFFQQSTELRQNSDALLMQADELRNSVEQQKILAESSNESLKFQIDAFTASENKYYDSFKPIFAQQASRCHLNTLENSQQEWILNCKILNTGNRCSQLRVHSDYEKIILHTTEKIINTNEIFSITCRFEKNTPVSDVVINIYCSDALGKPFKQSIYIMLLEDINSPYALTLDSYFEQMGRI